MRTLRMGKTFISLSPVLVVKILSRWFFVFPSSTGAKDWPSMPVGTLPSAKSISVGRISTQLTMTSVRAPALILPGQ